jgi:hypothetical protein
LDAVIVGGTRRANVVPNPLGRLMGGTPLASVVLIRSGA